MGLLLDLTGPALPGVFPTPPRMLAGTWTFTWTAGFNSSVGPGAQWGGFFVFFEDDDGFTDGLEFDYNDNDPQIRITQVSGHRLSQPIGFTNGQTLTFTVDPVAKMLRIAGADSGNGTFFGAGGPWFPNAVANVRVGGYASVAQILAPYIGGTFSDVEGFDAAASGAGTFSAVGGSINSASATASGAGTFSAVGGTSNRTAAASGAGTFSAVASQIISATALAVGEGTFAAIGASLGTQGSLFSAFLAQLQALLPPGEAWSRAPDAVITKILRGFVPEFARVQERAEDMLREINPATAVEMLPEYEAANGLPDPCFPVLGSIPERQASLIARLREGAGHNPDDYVAIAEAYGLAGTTVTRRPFPPFCVGESGCGERLYDESGPGLFIVSYMPNRIALPNDFGTTWATGGTSSVSTNVANGPDGNAGADRLTLGSTSVQYQMSAPAVTHLQFSLWMKSETTDMLVEIYAFGVLGQETRKTVTVDRRWRRFELRVENLTGINVFGVGKGAAATQTVLAWGACAGQVSERFECRMSHVQQAHTDAVYRVIGDLPKD